MPMESTRKRPATSRGASRPLAKKRAAAGPATPIPKHERKATSHVRIVEEASKLLRERGIDGASVDEVMAAAGLTRGGFYAHFADKTHLVAEAIEHAFDGAVKNLFGSDMPHGGTAWRGRAARRYLSESHLDDPGRGCAAPALGAEVSRSEPALRDVMGRQIERVLEEIEGRIDAPDRRAEAIGFLATCVGGMLLARAVGDRALSREILAAARRAASKTDDER